MATQAFVIKGKVEEIGKVQSFSSGFTKRDLILETATGKYPNPVRLTFKKENCSMLDNFKKGMEVEVKFSVDGRKWEGPKGVQYFVDLTGWHISASAGSADKSDVPEPAAQEESGLPTEEDLDDMPF